MKKILIIDNVRSAHNIGAMFRTADGAGIDFVYLVGISPLPVDRFGRVNKEISKTALGAEKSVPWKYVKSLKTLVNKLKKEGVSVVALEIGDESTALFDYVPKDKWALIVGNEVDGIDRKYFYLCDSVLMIPMRGKKESLNVSVATGIALYHLSSF